MTLTWIIFSFSCMFFTILEEIPVFSIIIPPVCSFSLYIICIFLITVSIFPINKVVFTSIIFSFSCMFFTILEEIPVFSIIIPPVCCFSFYIICIFLITVGIFTVNKVVFTCIIFSFSCMFFTILEEEPFFSISVPPICCLSIYIICSIWGPSSFFLCSIWCRRLRFPWYCFYRASLFIRRYIFFSCFFFLSSFFFSVFYFSVFFFCCFNFSSFCFSCTFYLFLSSSLYFFFISSFSYLCTFYSILCSMCFIRSSCCIYSKRCC